MPVLDRIPLQRTVALVREDSIAVRPSRGQLLVPLVQAAIAGGAVWLMVAFFNSLPMALLVLLLIVSLLMGPIAVLGLVYNVAGTEFLIERPKQSARWQQGFLGLGIGTAELVPFWRIAYVEVATDAEDDLASGQQQDLVQFDVRIVKDNERVLDVGSIVVARSLADEGRERANRLVSAIGEMTGREARPLAAPDAAPALEGAPAAEVARRRRRSRRRRPAPRAPEA